MENLTLTSNTVNGIELPSVSVAITPAVITTNYEELDKAITKIADSYRIIQYSEDPETQIKQMKADRSALNKLSKAVNDEKIRIKKEASKEISSFEDNFKKLLEKIADPVTKIDAGIKDIEEKRREEKRNLTKKIYEDMAFPVSEDCRDHLYDFLFEDKFLNSTTSMKYIRDTFAEGIRQYVEGINSLNALTSDCKDEGVRQFKRTFDLAAAKATVERLQKQQEEAEKRLKEKMEAEKQAAIKEAEERIRKEEQKKAEESSLQLAQIYRPSSDSTLFKNNSTISPKTDEDPLASYSKPEQMPSPQSLVSEVHKPRVFLRINKDYSFDVFSDTDLDFCVLNESFDSFESMFAFDEQIKKSGAAQIY